MTVKKLSVLLLLGVTVGVYSGSVTLNPNIGSNWVSPKYTHNSNINTNRKSSISRESSVSPSDSPVYSTLPDALTNVNSNSNSFGVAYVPEGTQNQAQAQNPQNYYNYQVVDPQAQAQATSGSFNYQPVPGNGNSNTNANTGFNFPGILSQFQGQGQNQQDGFFPGNGNGGFETNELQETESPGFFGGLMNSLLENTGLGALINGMREMLTNITGMTELPSVFGSFRTVMMSAMALPLMLPMAGIPIAMGLMGLMAFPILQLTLPGIRRSMSDTAMLTQNVIRSEECVERLSCSLARITRKIPYEGWLARFEKSDNRWLTRVSKSVKAARTGEDCKQFTCAPVTRVQNIVRSYILGEKEKDGETALASVSAPHGSKKASKGEKS